jgi:hypothetical protein
MAKRSHKAVSAVKERTSSQLEARSFAAEQRTDAMPAAPQPFIPSGIVVRTEGQRMFLHVTGSYAAIAQEIQCRTISSIHDWKTGKRQPNPDARAKLHFAFGIPVEAWDLEPTGTKLPDASPPPHVRLSTLNHCFVLLDTISKQRAHPAVTNAERTKLALAETKILALRAQLERSAELAEIRYIREHPGWIKLRNALTRALLPHPIAAKAVIDVLAKLNLEEETPSDGAAS